MGCPAELLMIQQQKHGRPLMQEARRIVAKYGPTGLYRGLVRSVNHSDRRQNDVYINIPASHHVLC